VELERHLTLGRPMRNPAGRLGIPLALAQPGARNLALGVVIVAALGLCACGRNGPLDLPPSAATSQPAPAAASAPVSASSLLPTAPSPVETARETAARTGFDSHGNPVAAEGPKRPFVLDPLLQ
jgi:predicted small lipoprotein YifL